MKTQDNIGVEFVNTVIGRGSLNNVINLSFGTFLFTPDDNDPSKILLDTAVSCRLRMDRVRAKQLRDVMVQLIAEIEEAEAKAAMGVPDTKIEGVIAKPRAEEIN